MEKNKCVFCWSLSHMCAHHGARYCTHTSKVRFLLSVCIDVVLEGTGEVTKRAIRCQCIY